MPDLLYLVGDIILIVAAVLAVWSAIRRRQLMRRFLRSLTPEQRAQLGLDPPAEK